MAGWLALGAVTGAIVGLCEDQNGHLSGFLPLVGWDKALPAAVATATGCLVVAGACALLGGAALPLLPLVAVAVAAWLLARRRIAPSTETAGIGGPDVLNSAGSAPSGLSVDALCLAWHQMEAALSDSTTADQRRQLSQIRDGLLDEIERRQTPGLARWLNAPRG